MTRATTALGLLLLAWPAPTRTEEAPRRGDDAVMEPTRLGLRMTPFLARGAARNWLLNMCGARIDGTRDEDSVELSDGQRQELVDAVSRRMLGFSARHGDQGRQVVEAFIEGAIRGEADTFTPESARDVAGRIKPMMPAMREFLDGVAEDGRKVLDEEQFARFRKRLDGRERAIDRLAERVERWERGEVRASESPFKGLEPSNDERGDDDKLSKQEKEHRDRLRQARRSTRWEMSQLGPQQWRQYLDSAAFFFKFDDEQRADGERILADYRRQAEATMDDEWRRKVEKNRLMYHLRWHLAELNGGPWEYQLRREFDGMVEPIREMGLAFRREIVGLITDEQCEAAVARVREALEPHGMKIDQSDLEMLGLAGP